VYEAVLSGICGSKDDKRAGNDRFIDHNLTILRMSRMEQIYGRVLAQHIRMRMKELTSRQLFSVPCPRCGAATGNICELHSGGLRFEPHLDRKLSAVETVERKRMHVDAKPLSSKIAKRP
jgi:hypothetical protein